MVVLQAWLDGYRKIFCYQGRARRSEFGYFLLIQLLLLFVIAFISSEVKYLAIIIVPIYLIASLLATLSYNVRRLHDANLSGWICLAYLISMGVIVIVSVFIPPTKGDNQYGPDPKDKAVVEEEQTTIVS